VVDLLFTAGLGNGDLVFGSSGTPPVILALGSSATMPAATLAGVLNADGVVMGGAPVAPAISSPVHVSEVPALSMAATMGAPAPALGLGYDNAVNRAPFRWAEGAWQDADQRSHFAAAAHAVNHGSETGAIIGVGAAIRRSVESAPAWELMDMRWRHSSHLPWGAGTRLGSFRSTGFVDLLRHLRPELLTLFDEGAPRRFQAASPWIELFRRPRPELRVPWGSGAHLTSLLVAVSGAGAPCLLSIDIPWQQAGRPGHGVSSVPGEPPGPVLYIPDPALIFDDSAPATPFLVFGRDPNATGPIADVVIPVLRAYIVVNDVTLLRTDNSLALHPLSLSVSIDADSWVWGWQTSLPASSLEDVLPSAPGAPVEFLATINGVSFLLLAESVTRDRRFAQARITVSGRGIAAELGNPYAATVSRNNASDMTAQQVMEAALTISGVGIGWSLDWQLTDWLIPAGSWSHTGSHIEAVSRIAEAAGGYVQADRNARTLRILPRYPVAPWDWAGVTPAFSLPSSATTRESIAWLEKPAYNAVYVTGEGAGVLARIKRAGTSGDRVAPMITDPLITHVDAARQRGLSILSDVGQQQTLALDTPLFSGVGIYPVGSFVAFSDGANSRTGIVRSLSITAALPTVRQTVEIECRA
jgi:hypothetical protein